MKRLGVLAALCVLSTTVMAQEDTVRASYVRERFHEGNLSSWLDAMSDHTVMQGLHTGYWDERGMLMFSVDGNSYRWNRYYIDGFRVDNRFQPGSPLYTPNLEYYDMRLDTRASLLSFDLDTLTRDYASVSWNRGNLGGISHGTADIIHIFHGTGTEGAYDRQLIQHRQYVRGAGTVDMAYTLRDKHGRGYRQHLLASVGQQQYPNYDETGLLPQQPLYPAESYKVQLDGQLPSGKWFDRLGYLINFSGTDNYGADAYFNRNEVSRLNTYSASLFGRHRGLTTGLTWSMNHVRHDDLQFSRNVIDQDGESLEPWMADGKTHELTWSLAYERPLLSWLRLSVDGYNSLLAFRPSETRFANDVYLQYPLSPAPTPLYRYEWTSHNFAAGLFENKAVVAASHAFNRKFAMRGTFGLTLDGILLGGRTKISPNLQASISLDYRPAKWFRLGVTLAHDRASYNIEDVRYMSRDYMSAEVYYAGTNHLFTTTGGRYHHYAHRLQQPAYVTVDIPIRFRFGRHEIALLQTYKKFYHAWMTRYADGSDANDFYDANGYYFTSAGERNYVVGYQPTSLMGEGFFTNTPYYLSQLSRYTYTGRKFTFSLSWQSMMGVGLAALGHGPASNNIGVLSETTANPNTRSTITNASARYSGVGRLDQDKAYVCRIYLGYNVSKHFQFGVTGRWTDGQPILIFNTSTSTDMNGDTQVAIRPVSSRGINPTDGNFGCRESAIFNIDLHARASWRIGHHDMSLHVLCYNIYDFGNVLTEYSFPQSLCGEQQRGPNMTLTIPRGIRATLKIEL